MDAKKFGEMLLRAHIARHAGDPGRVAGLLAMLCKIPGAVTVKIEVQAEDPDRWAFGLCDALKQAKAAPASGLDARIAGMQADTRTTTAEIVDDGPEADGALKADEPPAAVEVCICGRSRGSGVHDDGAVNGHAFEAMSVRIEADEPPEPER